MNVLVFDVHLFSITDNSTWAAWTPQVCVQSDDRVLQHDFKWSKEPLELQRKNIWPSVQRSPYDQRHKSTFCANSEISFSFDLI